MPSDRNKPCACGSGIKTKKCCSRPLTKEELEARAQEVRERWEADRERREEKAKKGREAALAVMGMAAAMSSVGAMTLTHPHGRRLK